MPQHFSVPLDRLFVLASALVSAAGVAAIAAMLLAAFAFANGTSISIPLVATFNGVRELDGTPVVTIKGSWSAAGIVTVILAAPFWVLALRPRASRRRKAIKA